MTTRLSDEELERELGKLSAATAASLKWQDKVAKIEQSIAKELAYPASKYAQSCEVIKFIRAKLMEEAKAWYEEKGLKVQEMENGTITLKISQDFIIEDDEDLIEFVQNKEMGKQLIKLTFDKPKLKKWLATMQEVGEEIEGARFDDKFTLAITWPKEEAEKAS